MAFLLETHTALSIIYPALDYFVNGKLKGYTLSSSIYLYVSCAVLLLLSYTFKKRIPSAGNSFSVDFLKILSKVMTAFALIVGINLLFYIKTWTGMFVMLLFYFIVFLTRFVKNQLKKNGLYESIYCFMLIPLIILTSEICFFGDFSHQMVIKFMPINLIYFTVLITAGAAKVKASKGLNIFQILTRQDSFRALVLIYLYLLCHAVIDSFNTGSILPLFPFVFLAYSFLAVANMVKNKEYEGAFQENKRTYVIFAIIYIFSGCF